MPFSGRVMVEEEQFLELVDQLRVAVPDEIKKAQRVIKERERIIAEAQDEATKILDTARKRAEYFVSEQGILNEARQQSEAKVRRRGVGRHDARTYLPARKKSTKPVTANTYFQVLTPRMSGTTSINANTTAMPAKVAGLVGLTWKSKP